MLQIGDIKIHLINDGNTLVDPGGAFGLVPRALWSRYYTPEENQLITMTETCLLVQIGDQNIVVDTGMGMKMTEKQMAIWHLTRPDGDLLAGLARLDIAPEDISLVINTHLHADHCSGNTRFNTRRTGVEAVFPNAKYVVQRREYEDACQPNERTAATYHRINWDVLLRNKQMQLLDGDTELASGVWGVMAPGHTPGHMAIRFESQGQHALFTSDMSSYAIHFERLGWMTAYDVEPLITLETKRKWQQWALETKATIIFPHDKQRPAGYLTKDDRGKTVIVSVDEEYV
jgi:glyoxylase-like metal-dependent hydrolase (beta-lactamase superfamily II)